MADDNGFDISAPATGLIVVTPDDDTDLPALSRAIYVGGGGALAVEMADGSAGVFSALPADMMLPIRARRVLVTGTTATALVALT